MNSTIINLITIFIEAIGFSLALIEIFWPKLADRIEATIDAGSDFFREVGDNQTRTVTYQVLVSMSILFVLVFHLGTLLAASSTQVDFIDIPWWCWWFINGTILATMGGFIIYWLSDFIDLLNRLSPKDRAISTLGLFIALTGFIVNILQMF